MNSQDVVVYKDEALFNIKSLKEHVDVVGPNIAKSKVELVNHVERPKLPFEELIQKHGFYIAGGAVVSLIWKTDYNDIDLFMVNAANPVEQIDSFIKELPKVVRVSRNGCCATITMEDQPKIQIIFYNYKSMEEILSNFDIGSCSFILSTDGNIYTDKKGAVAYTCKLNRLNLEMRQSSLEPRLVKYLKRGFSVQIDGFKLIEGLTIYPYIALYVKDGQLIDIISKRYNIVSGYNSVLLPHTMKYCIGTTTNYESIEKLNNSEHGSIPPVDYTINYSDLYRKDALHTHKNYYNINHSPINFDNEIVKYIDYYKFPLENPDKITLLRMIAKLYGFSKCMFVLRKWENVSSISEKLYYIEWRFQTKHDYEEVEVYNFKENKKTMEKIVAPPKFDVRYFQLTKGQQVYVNREIQKLIDVIRGKNKSDERSGDSKIIRALTFDKTFTAKQILQNLAEVYVMML